MGNGDSPSARGDFGDRAFPAESRNPLTFRRVQRGLPVIQVPHREAVVGRANDGIGIAGVVKQDVQNRSVGRHLDDQIAPADIRRSNGCQETAR